ncbi:MAG: hypothetical protein IT360_14715 [Gemmatimonadaceae bacterium]|nr:hypothetical protein [Gemmatimonadaceae bacterium]
MKKLLSTSAFSLVAAVLLAACSIDAPPTAPTMLPSSDAVSLGKSPEQIAKKAAKEARKDSLEAIRDSIKTAAKLDKELLKAQLRLDKDAWKAFKKDLKLQRKLDKFASLELLQCEPLGLEVEAEVIGPDGGTLRIGSHKLVIPAGALDEDELIVGTAPMGSLVQVVFGPHGLNFKKSAELTLDYGHCLLPTLLGTGERYRLAYVNESLQILELPPSKNSRVEDKVVGTIDHFSSYMIAY